MLTLWHDTWLLWLTVRTPPPRSTDRQSQKYLFGRWLFVCLTVLFAGTQLRLAGYQRRAVGLAKSTASNIAALQQKRMELECFLHLDHLEQDARKGRLQTAERKLREEVCGALPCCTCCGLCVFRVVRADVPVSNCVCLIPTPDPPLDSFPVVRP